MTTAVVFPGQGSQKPGMGRDFHDAFPESRDAFREAADALGLDIAGICFDADDERLALTEFQQPAILVTEIAMLSALRAHFGFAPTVFAGHSLGEYSALVAAGVIPFTEAVMLVRERGRLMQRAVAAGEGAMVALMHQGADGGFNEEVLARLIDGLKVDVANRNAPTQLVLSGLAADVERAVELVRTESTLGRVRAIPLRVSAPFHSRAMAPIEAPFRELLERSAASWRPAAASSVASNRTGAFHGSETAAVVDALVRQISGTVRWTDNMDAITRSAQRVIEVGPGRPLRAFFAAGGVDVASITDIASAEAALAAA